MHELQLMKQIVGLVEEVSKDQPRGAPAVIRIQISSHSHLAEHSPHELDTTFHLAAHGTSAQGAKLDIITISVNGRCGTCDRAVERASDTLVCPICGSGNLVWQDQPEVVLKEIEWVDESS